jgi:hypothetical protein
MRDLLIAVSLAIVLLGFVAGTLLARKGRKDA